MGIFPRRLFLYTEKHLVLQAAYKFLKILSILLRKILPSARVKAEAKAQL